MATRYADILKKGPDPDTTVQTADPLPTTTKSCPILSNRAGKPPQCLWGGVASYDRWVYAYFGQLMDMRNIFVRTFAQETDCADEYLNSVEFFDLFTRMIYDHSSGKISRFLAPLTDDLENAYTEFSLREQT